jgi:hypothetical protein
VNKSLFLFSANADVSLLKKGLYDVLELEETGANNRVGQKSIISLTAVNAPSTATGKILNGVILNGTTQYLTGAKSAWSFANTSYSIAAWIKRSASGVNQGVFGNYRAGAGNVEWHFYINSSNQLIFRVSQDGSTAALTINYGTLTLDTWYHIGITYNANTGVYAPYLNGSVITGATLAGGMYSSGTLTAFDLGRFNSSNLLTGMVDQLAQYRIVKPAATFIKLYNGGNGVRIL